MWILDKLGRGRSSSSSSPQEDKRGQEMDTGEAIFDDSDKEKERLEEWWLQKGEEEAVDDEAEEGGEKDENELMAKDGEENKEEQENAGDRDMDELIYSLREEEEEEDDMSSVLRSAMEELGDISAEELLALGRTALHEAELMMGERRGDG